MRIVRNVPSIPASAIRDKLESLAEGSRLSARYLDDAGFRVDITKDTVFPLTLKSLVSGNFIKRATIRVTEIWDATFFLSIGFPADHDEIMTEAENDLTAVADYEKTVNRVSAGTETLTLYATGTPTKGTATIFIDEL